LIGGYSRVIYIYMYITSIVLRLVANNCHAVAGSIDDTRDTLSG